MPPQFPATLFFCLPSCRLATPLDLMSGTVCSMCGDVGFQDKLFRCARCRCRFQHSYCTNYYGDAAQVDAAVASGVCDWCLSDDDTLAKNRRPSAPAAMQQRGTATGISCGKDKVTGGGDQEGGRRVAKAGVRRYKLLKDVLC